MKVEGMNILGKFEETGALLKGHFLLSSGLHSPNYMQCALLLANPKIAETMGQGLATMSPNPDLVVSPAMGGLIIGQEVARALKVRHYFTERENGVMTMRRGFTIKRGETVVVVEDVVTTGKSSQEVISLIERQGGKVLAVICIVDRTGGATTLKVDFRGLMRLEIPSYQPDECPQCKQGIPVVKPGSRPQPL